MAQKQYRPDMEASGGTAKRRRLLPWLLGGLGVLLVVGALIFYFAALPGILASDYKDQARPEHEKVRTAMSQVYATFSPATIGGTSTTELRKAKGPDAFVRALHKVIARERRVLQPVTARIHDARGVLRDADRKALTDVADPPAIGGSGDLDKASGIAGDEQRYLSSAAKYLSSYERLVRFYRAELRFLELAGTSLGTGFAHLPKNAGSPEAFAAPVDRIAGKLEREVRDGRKIDAPRDERSEKRELLAIFSAYAKNIRGFADAIRARDLAKVKAFPHQLAATAKRYRQKGRGEVRRILTHSAYSRAIEGLQRLEDRIARGYERL
jgi:hypothetical protein